MRDKHFMAEDVNPFNAISIKIASPESIKSWSKGWPVERVVDDQTVFVVDEQIHDYRFLFLAVVHSSVCKYLELRKKRLLAPTVSITVPSP